ncbi:hypothetical protein K438DRAFT_2079242 [Mycena galopus ATCC 62051]|nr:hypothetical protein K438DRAFT_2079242 [Mycena galopus ATCC 62051]
MENGKGERGNVAVRVFAGASSAQRLFFDDKARVGNPMHRSLNIAEIRDSIFAQIPLLSQNVPSYMSEAYRAGCKSFAALARTCKSFQDPALDFLWRNQYTLVNVFKCLPSHNHLWQIQDDGDLKLRANRTSREDWDRPLAYASRIRMLQLPQEDFELVAIFERVRVDYGLRRDHLLPDLREIRIRFINSRVRPDLTSCASLFRSPRIIVVDIEDSTPDSLSGIPIPYSQLTTLNLFISSRMVIPCDVRDNIALALKEIEHLTCDSLGRAAMEHISQLPGLQSLSLEAPTLLHLPPPKFRSSMDSQTPLFPVLRHISFDDTSFQFAIAFLDLNPLSTWSVVDFDVGTTLHATTMATRQLYTTLATRLSHSALETLQTTWGPGDDDDEQMPSDTARAGYSVDGHLLAVLFCFTNLTQVSLVACGGFDIDDAMAWDIARAWPRLTDLVLTELMHIHHPPRITLLGLKAFATHCPALEYLSIAFNASVVPPSGGSTETISPQLLLTQIQIDTCPITDPPAVAEFLGVLFPNLAIIHISYVLDPDRTDEERSWCARWRTVNELLPAFIPRQK